MNILFLLFYSPKPRNRVEFACDIARSYIKISAAQRSAQFRNSAQFCTVSVCVKFFSKVRSLIIYIYIKQMNHYLSQEFYFTVEKQVAALWLN